MVSILSTGLWGRMARSVGLSHGTALASSEFSRASLHTTCAHAPPLPLPLVAATPAAGPDRACGCDDDAAAGEKEEEEA